MKSTIIYLFLALTAISLNACVSKKKFLASEEKINQMMKINKDLRDDNTSLLSRLNLMEEANNFSNEELEQQKKLLDEKEKEIAAKENALEEKDAKIKSLQEILDKQKSGLSALKANISKALGNFKAEDLSVHSKNGKVYVSLSEKLLFASGSAEVNAEGKKALEKLAQALKENPEIEIMVEGHTDSIPIKIKFQDNWALSVARSTAIVRILTQDYGIDPKRIIASGHSEFDPLADNSTPEGRAKNRRTEIILSPKMDEVYKLLQE